MSKLWANSPTNHSRSCFSYLGLAAYSIALRRLRGSGVLGAGVSVIMRYTLRLLTLDQLSRAAGPVCALEIIRTRDANGRKTLGE
jgi:hypothetical protein